MTQSHNPKVSMGLPVYNGERYLAETLDSLLAQTFEDFELIIADNASNDGTEEICRAYAKRDSRIRYLRNPINIGAIENHSFVCHQARGEYFRWVAGDDLSAPELLSRCVEVLDGSPDAVLAYPKTILIGARGQVLSDYEDRLDLPATQASDRFRQITQELGLCNAIFGVIRMSTLKKTKLMRKFSGSDMPFLAELSLHGKFVEVPQRLFTRRIHPSAFSSSTSMSVALQWVAPGSRRRVSFNCWRHCLDYLGMALRAPLAPAERLRVFAHSVRLAWWRRLQLFNELLTVGHFFGGGLMVQNREDKMDEIHAHSQRLQKLF